MAPAGCTSFVGARLSGGRCFQFDPVTPDEEMSVRLTVLAPLLAALPGVASAEPMAFNVALERAAANAPSVQANAAGVEASRSSAIAAGQLPDPTLSVGIDNFPISGPPAFSFNRDDMTMARVGI